MTDNNNIKAIQKDEDASAREEKDDQSCCVYIDACGCYVDPCCCSLRNCARLASTWAFNRSISSWRVPFSGRFTTSLCAVTMASDSLICFFNRSENGFFPCRPMSYTQGKTKFLI